MKTTKAADALTSAYEDGMAHARTIIQLETQKHLWAGNEDEAKVLLRVTNKLQERMTGDKYPQVLTRNQEHYERSLREMDS